MSIGVLEAAYGAPQISKKTGRRFGATRSRWFETIPEAGPVWAHTDGRTSTIKPQGSPDITNMPRAIIWSSLQTSGFPERCYFLVVYGCWSFGLPHGPGPGAGPRENPGGGMRGSDGGNSHTRNHGFQSTNSGECVYFLLDCGNRCGSGAQTEPGSGCEQSKLNGELGFTAVCPSEANVGFTKPCWDQGARKAGRSRDREGRIQV